MLNIFITLLTFLLVLTSCFMMLTILMQRPNSNAGMGAAFGGGITESTFGADTTNILTKATRYAAIAFFFIAITLFLLHIEKASLAEQDDTLTIPEITVEASADAQAVEAEAIAPIADTVVEETEAAATAAEAVVEEAAIAVEDAAEEVPAADSESSK